MLKKEDPRSSISYKNIKYLCKRHKLDQQTVYRMVTEYHGLETLCQGEAERQGKQFSSAEGIDVHTFVKNCELFRQTHPDVIPTILDGLGIKVKTKRPLMNKENFFFIYCIMKFGKGSEADL